MKLKILPPHLRNKKRYLAFEVISQKPLTREDVIYLIWEAAAGLYGACGTSNFDLWVVKIWNCDVPHKNVLKGMLRCNRAEIDAVRAIIPNITRFKGGKVVSHTLGISGTIKSSTKKFIKLKE